eukprot:g3740.t1
MASKFESKAEIIEGEGSDEEDDKGGAMSIRRTRTVVLADEPLVNNLGRSIALLFICVLPAGLFGVLFSRMGYAATVYSLLADENLYDLSRKISLCGVALLKLLYLLDFTYWQGCWKYVRNGLILLSTLTVAGGILLMARDYPAFPLLGFLLSVPLYLLAWFKCAFKRTEPSYFLHSLSNALFVTGLAGIAVWSVFQFGGDKEPWPGENSVVKLQNFVKFQCSFTVHFCVNHTSLSCGQQDTAFYGPGQVQPSHASGDCYMAETLCIPREKKGQQMKLNVHGDNIKVLKIEAQAGSEGCTTAAFLTYVSLLVAAGLVLVFSFITHFLSLSLKMKSKRTMTRVFSMMLALTVLGMWISTEIAGATPQLSNIVMVFSGAGIFVLICTVGAFIGWESLHMDIMKIPIVASIRGAAGSDWLKAMLIFMAPFYVMFVCISMMNQFFRLYLTPCGKRVDERERHLRTTLAVNKQLRAIYRWPWSGVLQKMMFLGVFYFVFNVGVGKLTYVFLSWLNQQLAAVPLPVCTAIFYAVGLTMFLLPPVPGVPVYLLGGVLITNNAEKTANMPFFAGAMFTTVVCFLIKLNAIAIQQKVIGQQMSGYLYIRQQCMVNSITIRAIRKILSSPGLSWAKVAILCGGPDWPTSVLTGILRLSLVKMLIGSLPVFFLILPTVFAGAFILKKNESALYAGLANIATMGFTMVQTAARVASMYYIENTSAAHRQELENMEDDKEVAEADAKIAKIKLIKEQVTKWGLTPWWIKLVYLLGCGSTFVFCWAYNMFMSRCFVKFDVTDSIETELCGYVHNMVLPNGGCVEAAGSARFGFGHVMLILVVVDFVCMRIISGWSSRELKRALNSGGVKVVPAHSSKGGSAEAVAADESANAEGCAQQ